MLNMIIIIILYVKEEKLAAAAKIAIYFEKNINYREIVL